MNINISNRSTKQKGMVTLFTSVILLVAITLVAIFTAKIVIQETKMTANNKRAQQAFFAADGAMDYAIAYFNDGGLDHDGNGVVDVDVGVGVLLNATILFNNNDGNCTNAGNMKSALITTTGTSLDETASRDISVCVGSRGFLKGGGPKQSMISGASVGLTGSAQIINRYSDLNIWSADTISIDNSSAMETYIRPTDIEVEDLTEAELISTETTPQIPDVQKVSSNGLGAGTDIYMEDARLAAAMAITNASPTKDGDGSFFDLFFNETKAVVAEMANSIQPTQRLTGDDSCVADGKNGIIWIDGDDKCTGGDIGIPPDFSTTPTTPGHPAIVIVDGDLDLGGGVNVYGLVYVTGELTVSGTATVQGTIISEGSVAGNGTLRTVYTRNFEGDSNAPIKGAGLVVSGSWRDW